MRILPLLLALLIPLLPNTLWAADDLDSFEFDDRPLIRDLKYPEWFKLSFLDLAADVEEAAEANKQGIMVYFGQKHCPYCKALLENNFGRKDIVGYTRKHFDVVAIDIWGDREVTTMDGRILKEKQFAEEEKVHFTPTLYFYNTSGKRIFRLQGYAPPYRFRAALEYVADGHYLKENFRDYMERADPPLAFEADELNEHDTFSSPPYALTRNRFPAQTPLAVFFEQSDCHACDVLHTGPLQDPEILAQLSQFESIQLDMWSDTPVLTPSGQRITARQWADRLGIAYAPTILFFDEHGKEVFRVSSVVRFYRLHNVLDYVLRKGYLQAPTFARWREMQGATDAGTLQPAHLSGGSND